VDAGRRRVVQSGYTDTELPGKVLGLGRVLRRRGAVHRPVCYLLYRIFGVTGVALGLLVTVAGILHPQAGVPDARDQQQHRRIRAR